MRTLIEAIIAIMLSALLVGAVVVFIGVGSGLIDPYRFIDSEPRRYPMVTMETGREITAGMEVIKRKKEHGR